MKNLIKSLNFIFALVLVLSVALLIFVSFSPVKQFQVLRVMSGSMEPNLKVGSVIFVVKTSIDNLNKGDIIAFKSADDQNISVTHRISKIEEKDGQKVFGTKGDANETEDGNQVTESQIIGRVMLDIPYLGYLSVWLKKPLGLLLLVVLPAILIVLGEIYNIKKTIEEDVKRKLAREQDKRGSNYMQYLGQQNSRNYYPNHPPPPPRPTASQSQPPPLQRPKRKII